MKKLLTVLLVAIIAVAVVIGGRWLLYVTNTSDPLDEVGIELNLRMPKPLRQWGCAQLKANFADRLPPYGCTAADGSGDWE
ncbi:hypothetical protein ADU59_06175 [Pararhizobium polonicum]|uniref:Uncharacterized protein n=1 Tax=Pararhizobium polonicum TaxID=1612624 RepID=A0A1C7P3Y3_9HYPH|nr:hypothetical protein [Pararhizobium polonicum]OBZ95975.1 hypothetical protein ADU59_06175 [Pararhizobium polonicum]